MNELIHKRKWDSKTFDTGRKKKNLPVYNTLFQNGLHDEEPDGSYVDVNAKFMDHEVGVSTDRVIRNRCGEVRISDTGSESKDLAKIKTKRNCGVSLKLKGIKTYGPFFDDLKSCYYNTDDGVKLRYYPHYKGVSIVVEIANPQTAPNVYRFSLKEYGCDYTYEEIDGAIKCISSTGKDDIWIKATYAIDGNGDSGYVHMRLGSVVDGYQEVEKVIAPVWLGNATAPVLSDPDVTIIDGVDSGVIEDTILQKNWPTYNYGISQYMQVHRFSATNQTNELLRVGLSDYSNITVTNAYWGVDIYQASGSFHWDLYKIIAGSWVEGTRFHTTALTGEPTWDSRLHSGTPWNTAGCEGSGTDHEAVAESNTLVSAVDSDKHLPLTTATVQDWIDNSATNYGNVIKTSDAVAGSDHKARSSETVTGNKPYFYMEYTEAVVAGQKFAGIFGVGRIGVR